MRSYLNLDRGAAYEAERWRFKSSRAYQIMLRVAQLVEHHTVTVAVTGSNPASQPS